MKHLDEYDLSRLHNVRDLLKGIHNGTDSEYAENKLLTDTLESIEKAISVNPNKPVFKF